MALISSELHPIRHHNDMLVHIMGHTKQRLEQRFYVFREYTEGIGCGGGLEIQSTAKFFAIGKLKKNRKNKWRPTKKKMQRPILR
jgi:hypothetical protein